MKTPLNTLPWLALATALSLPWTTAEALAARGAGLGREVVRAGRVVDVVGVVGWGAP